MYLWEYEQHTSVAILELVLYPGVILDPLLHLCSIEQRFKGYGKLDDIQTDVYPSGGYQEPVAFYSPKYDKGNKDNALYRIFVLHFIGILAYKQIHQENVIFYFIQQIRLPHIKW